MVSNCLCHVTNPGFVFRYVHGEIKVSETNVSDHTPVHVYHTIVPSQIHVPGYVIHEHTETILAAISLFNDTARDAYRQGNLQR